MNALFEQRLIELVLPLVPVVSGFVGPLTLKSGKKIVAGQKAYVAVRKVQLIDELGPNLTRIHIGEDKHDIEVIHSVQHVLDQFAGVK